MGKSIESVINQMQRTERILLKVDNQAAITIAKPSSSTSWRTRHLRVRASYIHEQVESGEVVVSYVQGRHQWADLLTKSFPRQRLEELVGIWGFIDLIAEASKRSMVRMMVFCMMIQSSRAQGEDEPLALTTSMELYVMVILLGIAVVSMWEFTWWCVDRCCGEVRPSRSTRRLRNLQETVQREIEAQIAERSLAASSGSTPTTSSVSRTMTRTSTPPRPTASPSTARSPTASPPTARTPARPLTPTRTLMASSSTPPPTTSSMRSGPTMCDAGTQLDSRPLVCYQDREVPVPVPDPQSWSHPLYVSPNGDTFHTYEHCWGLRNTRPRAVRFCQCCRDNQGKSLRQR